MAITMAKIKSINKEFRHDLAPLYFVAFNCSLKAILHLKRRTKNDRRLQTDRVTVGA